MSESRNSGKKRRVRARACRCVTVNSTVKEGRFQEGKGGLQKNFPRRSRRKHERVSGLKDSPGGSGESSPDQEDLESLGFTPSLANLKWERRLGDKETAHWETGQNEPA